MIAVEMKMTSESVQMVRLCRQLLTQTGKGMEFKVKWKNSILCDYGADNSAVKVNFSTLTFTTPLIHNQTKLSNGKSALT